MVIAGYFSRICYEFFTIYSLVIPRGYIKEFYVFIALQTDGITWTYSTHTAGECTVVKIRRGEDRITRSQKYFIKVWISFPDELCINCENVVKCKLLPDKSIVINCREDPILAFLICFALLICFWWHDNNGSALKISIEDWTMILISLKMFL